MDDEFEADMGVQPTKQAAPSPAGGSAPVSNLIFFGLPSDNHFGKDEITIWHRLNPKLIRLPLLISEGNVGIGIKINLSQPFCKDSRSRRGFLMVDLIVALAILSLAVVPLGFSFARERQVLKIEYSRSVANELVDGEMEILAAGNWKDFPDGSQIYTVHSRAAASLPPGHFQLTKTGKHLRLEWISNEKRGIGAVVREVTVK